MTIQEYCDYHGIPSNQARTYKLVTHTGTPFYNIASNVLEPDVKDLDLTSFLKSVKPYKVEQGVVDEVLVQLTLE